MTSPRRRPFGTRSAAGRLGAWKPTRDGAQGRLRLAGAASRTGTRRDAGFTLLEMLVVLAILGLALGIVAARGPVRSPALDARGTADGMARALRLARSQAVAGNRGVAFTLDTARRAYRVDEGPWQALPPGLDVSMLAVAEADPARGRILFGGDGSATGGRIRVGPGLVVAVDWLSGRVSVGDAR